MTQKEFEQRDATVSREEIRGNLLAWILDLETTDAKQGVANLRTTDGKWCCLGRAYEKMGGEWESDGETFLPVAHEDAANFAFVRSFYGLKSDEVQHCWMMNDGNAVRHIERHTFREIAHYLRENVLPRFTDQTPTTPAEAPLTETETSVALSSTARKEDGTND